MSEFRRIIETLDRQIKEEWKLIYSGKAPYTTPPSLIGKKLFLKTRGYTLSDWKNVRGDEYFKRTTYMRWFEKKEYLLDLVEDYE